MAENRLARTFIEGPGYQRGDVAMYQVDVTATRLIISPYNSDADDVLYCDLTIPVKELRALLWKAEQALVLELTDPSKRNPEDLPR